jgi:hypothetical protein
MGGVASSKSLCFCITFKAVFKEARLAALIWSGEALRMKNLFFAARSICLLNKPD